MKRITMQMSGNLNHRSEPLPLDTMTAAQLLDLFRDGEHDIDRIVDFMSQNPALADETLRRCNSVAYSADEPTTDLFEAVIRLGYFELYNIVVASLSAQSWTPGATNAAADEAFWDGVQELPPPNLRGNAS